MNISIKRGCGLAAIILTALLGVYLLRHFYFIDFPVYYYSGRSLLAGRTDFYTPEFAWGPLLDYRYPPLFVFLVSPLSLLPFEIAAYIWFWICVLSIGGSVLIVRQIISLGQNDAENNRNTWRVIWFLTLLTTGQYFLAALKYGNVHLQITFLLFASFYLLMRHRDGWAALLMALAITIKLLPVIALPYFAVKKRWNFLILTAVFVVVLNLLPSLYLGFGKNAALLNDWYEHVVVNHEAHERDSWINLSLKGQLRRTLTDIDYSQRAAGTDNTDREYASVNVLSLSENTSNKIWAATAFLVYSSCLWLIWRTARRQKSNLANDAPNNRLLVEFSLIICLILLINPLTPKIYFIKLLLPFLCLAAVVFQTARSELKFCKIILIIVAVANLILPLLPGREIQRLLLVVGTDFYALCLLIIISTGLLLRRDLDSSRVSTGNHSDR